MKDGVKRLLVTVDGVAAEGGVLNASLHMEDAGRQVLRVPLPVKEVPHRADDRAGERRWSVESEVDPELAGRCFIQVYIEPEWKPRCTGTCYRIAVGTFPPERR